MKRILAQSIPILLVTALIAGPAPARQAATASLRLPETALTEQERVLHVLNRLGYGPRAGDMGRVAAMGLDTYIKQQLQPGSLPDAAVEKRLQAYETLQMPPVELLVSYPPPQLLRGISRQLTNRMGMDPETLDELFPELERFEKLQAEREKGDDPAATRAKEKPAPGERLQRMMDSPQRIVMELSQAKLIRATYGERQLQEVMTDFWFNHFNVFAGKGLDRWWISGYERDAIRPHALGNFRDLLGATARHPAMLFYLDNWLSSAPDAEFDRRVSERYASASIKQQGLPYGGVATLILKDRGMNTATLERQLERREQVMRRRGPRARMPAGAEQGPQRDGLNENYARELLELHTLGVDGGYTQQDIIEIARCFSGWTLLSPTAGQQFVFMSELHDGGTKTVMGQKVKDGGVREGEKVLDMLARHPSTARFVSTKLARRFVSDDPPTSLVERMAETFLETDGDIRRVMQTMIESPEFWSPDAVKSKVKTPLEFVVSLLRATGAQLADLPGIPATDDEGTATGTMMSLRQRAPGALGALRDLGQPLYAAQPPTGYKDTADAWVSTGALMNRFKVGFAVAADRLPGVRVDVQSPPGGEETTEAFLARLGRALVGTDPSESTLKSIERQLNLPAEELEELGVPRRYANSPEARARLAVAWLAASPEFQRR